MRGAFDLDDEIGRHHANEHLDLVGHGLHLPPLILRHGEAYKLALPDGEVDLIEFDLAISRARGARAAGDGPTALEAYRRALDLYRGELLPEDGPAEWVVFERERYRSAATEAAQLTGEMFLENNELESAALVCARGLQIDRHCDRLWQTRIRAHELAGEAAADLELRRRPALEARGERLARERALLTGSAEQGRDLERELEAATDRYLSAARELSQRRRRAATDFARRLEALVAELAMARTRFEVRFNEVELSADRWGERGVDEAELFVSPNPGEDLRPLARIVSGGELSRVMLALKTLAAGDAPGKTLVFDEVDAGIGGRVADVVGARLQALGQRFQVLCITHLPQIAAHATTQFRIEKTVRGKRTVTAVEHLDPDGREEEIARMMGGAAITPPVRASARELLRAGAKGKGTAKAKGESRLEQ